MTNPFKPISRVNLHSEVMQQITAAIQSGQWKSGSKLPGEIALAEMFQVSRTCIREVLKALAYSGVVESRSGVGTFVKDIPSEAPSPAVDLLSSTDYTQILEMRKLLEGQAAYWATERATPEEIAELESILKQEGLSLKDIHTRFHNGVTALSKNPILIHMLAEFQEQFKKQRELNFVILPDEDRLEHWKVLEAIKSGSPAKARRAMHQHIDYIWKKRPHLFPGKKGPSIQRLQKTPFTFPGAFAPTASKRAAVFFHQVGLALRRRVFVIFPHVRLPVHARRAVHGGRPGAPPHAEIAQAVHVMRQ